MKKCNKCLELKEFTEFFKDKNHSTGYYSICKVCKQEATYEWRNKNKDHYNKSIRDYQAKNPLKRDDCDLRRKYGVSRQWYDKTLESQNNTCAICNKPNTSSKRRFVVDHEHSTGLVRGILCYNCNRALHFFDDKKLFNNILKYITKHSDKKLKDVI